MTGKTNDPTTGRGDGTGQTEAERPTVCTASVASDSAPHDLDDLPPALPVSVALGGRKWAAGRCEDIVDDIAEEVPVALVYNGLSHAVMMSTPADLEDFALGFSLSEGIVARAGEVHDIQFQETAEGVAVHLSISGRRFAALKGRRRSLAGRTGCGICVGVVFRDIRRLVRLVL